MIWLVYRLIDKCEGGGYSIVQPPIVVFIEFSFDFMIPG